MANQTAAATVWNSPNFTGALFLIGANQTPFLNAIGGIGGTNYRTVGGWQYPIAQPYALQSAAQPAITETTSLTAPTAVTYVREQDPQAVQIFQKTSDVSWAKQSNVGEVKADTTIYYTDITGGNPVQDELAFQQQAALEQLSIDVEYTFLHGTYQQATSAAVASKMRGIATACTTNTVAAGSAYLSRSLINQLLRTMSGNGARFTRPAIFCNAFQCDQINELYAYAPPDRTLGGAAISQILTIHGQMPVYLTPKCSTTTLLVADLAFCQVVFLPVPPKPNRSGGLVFWNPMGLTGGGDKGMLHTQISIDYGAEEFHGTLTGLAAS